MRIKIAAKAALTAGSLLVAATLTGCSLANQAAPPPAPQTGATTDASSQAASAPASSSSYFSAIGDPSNPVYADCPGLQAALRLIAKCIANDENPNDPFNELCDIQVADPDLASWLEITKVLYILGVIHLEVPLQTANPTNTTSSLRQPIPPQQDSTKVYKVSAQKTGVGHRNTPDQGT